MLSALLGLGVWTVIHTKQAVISLFENVIKGVKGCLEDDNNTQDEHRLARP